MRFLQLGSVGQVDIVCGAAFEAFDAVAKAGELGVAGFDYGL